MHRSDDQRGEGAPTEGSGAERSVVVAGSLTAQHGSSDPVSAAPTDDDSLLDDLTTMALVIRSALGGVLMGMANLVPGISGGTMLLATGVYPRFIDAIAELTRFRFRRRSVLLLSCVIAAAGIAILLMAGTLKNLVVDHRWVMYSLFIGLTLGGLPVVWRLARPASAALIAGATVAFALMALLAGLQAAGVVGQSGSNFLWLFFAGLAGASAMILPGISGGYLLLLMGQYVPILAAIDELKSALKLRDFAALVDSSLSVVLPVGLGVVVGVVSIGNLLQWLLHHHQKRTLGVLLGLLLGSTVGLWPFQQSVPPQVGDVIKGQTVTATSIAEIEPDDWQTRYFQPTLFQLGGSLGLVLVGFTVTVGIAHIGRE